MASISRQLRLDIWSCRAVLRALVLQSSRSCSTRVSSIDEFYGKEVEEFKNENVQHLLKRLTGLDLDKIFARRREELKVPTYKLMDDFELKKAEEEIKKVAEERLNPPTVMTERKPIEKMILSSKEIAGHDESKYIFTDISTTRNTRDRRIVIREPTGVLREATWDERDRMDFMYFPSECQQYELPALLKDEHLETSFNQKHYSHVLDLAVLQCQPDDPNYIRVHKQTYEEVNKRNDFEYLKSTRHYSGFIFYIIKQNRAENFVRHLLDTDNLSDLKDFILLYTILHPDSDVAAQLKDSKLEIDGKVEIFLQHVCPEMVSYARSKFSKNQEQASNA